MCPQPSGWLQSTKKFGVAHACRRDTAYRDRVGRIVNLIKHRAGRFRPVFMHWNEMGVPGYFIEGVLGDGVVGPDPRIHPGGNTAISLFRDARYHFVHMYLVGSALQRLITDVMGTSPVEPPSGNPRAEPEFPIREVGRRLSLLPRIVFPDELHLPDPMIRLRTPLPPVRKTP